MRDNALVHAWRKMGHDCVMLPLYLPHLVDEETTANEKDIHLGGLNAYLQQKSPVFRRTPAWLDHWLNRPWLLKQLSRWSDRTSAQALGEMTHSTLLGSQGNQAKEVKKLADYLAGQSKFDLAILSNALLAGLIEPLKDSGCHVVVTLQGEDSFLDQLPEPWRQHCWELLAKQLKQADQLITVSQYYHSVMAGRLGLAEDSCHVVHNGISLEGYDQPASPTHPTIGYLARLCHGKGLTRFVDAAIAAEERQWLKDARYLVVGTATGEDVHFIKKLKQKLNRSGLANRFAWHINVTRERKIELLRQMSILSVPTTYGESFGLYILEALAAGVPVVQPDHAAFPELVEATGGGILCQPDDTIDLANQWHLLLLNESQHRLLAERGRKAVHDNFNIELAAENLLAMFTQAMDEYASQPEA